MYISLNNDGKTVKCYKPHNCEWCNGKIQIGEKAVARNYVYDDNVISSHQHPECYDAMNESLECIDEGFEQGMFKRGQTYEEWENQE